VSLDSLDTPALLLDADRLERNLREMAELCHLHGKALRPHVKSHKTIEIAARQRELGAVGLTVAKLGEAEVFADAGFDDLFVCYPVVGEQKLRRLVLLAQRARVSTIVDDLAAAAELAAAARAGATTIEVLLKIDLGMHRVGVPEPEVDRLARAVQELGGLKLRGICIHEGETYGERDRARRRSLARRQVGRLVEIAERLRAGGLAIDVVSSGATPAVHEVVDMDGLTEVRPGNYVFYDAMQAALGVVPEDRCALSVLATVVSRADEGRAIMDAGAKALTLDRGVHGLELLEGFGRPQGRADVEVTALSEEHGWLRVGPGSGLRLGDRLEIVPNHACAVVDNFDGLTLVERGAPAGEWRVAARGCMT
jgi:D-serine deaminase-like pyridoxal phosphate-dependent protein